MNSALLEVKDLKTYFLTEAGIAKAVDSVSFSIFEKQVLGIVGESGCGKSVTALSVLRLVPPPGIVAGGQILFRGKDLLSIHENEMEMIRGNEISMIFQEPMTSLNPVFRIADQIAEVLLRHKQISKKEARLGVIELLRRVGIPSPEITMMDYPHQMSGGMRQRVMIAMAIACNPRLIIADEPTTALDVTIQAQILSLLDDLRETHDMAILLITHDLGVIAEMAEQVLVMYTGRIVEHASVKELFENPLHPYTQGLMQSIPSRGIGIGRDRLKPIGGVVPSLLALPPGCKFNTRCPWSFDRCFREEPGSLRARGRPPGALLALLGGLCLPQQSELLKISAVKKYYPISRGLFRRETGTVKAVDGVDLEIDRGETLGLVGESGCGKSTLGRVILGLEPPTEGRVIFDGHDLSSVSGEELHQFRRRMQIIFQDPYSSLNPRQTVGRIIGEGLVIHKIGTPVERKERVRRIMEVVGLRPELINRYPHEFSGGQRQRIGIARALALHPELVICDEPLSALDVSIQAQVINLLKDLQQEFNLTYLFISHDLAVVRHISDRVAVMYLGQVVELAEAVELFNNPSHPYTRALLEAIPLLDPNRSKKRRKQANESSEQLMPESCIFQPRCPQAEPECQIISPELREILPGHWVKCLAYDRPSAHLSG